MNKVTGKTIRTMIYPGTFDPLTNGHLDIVQRAVHLCDRLVVAVLVNIRKKTVFSSAERVAMAELVLADLPTVVVRQHDGLLVDLYREEGASAVVRGLRSESDFRFEAEMAAANKLLLPEYETCLLPSRTDLAFTSSSLVREVAFYQGDISGMVPGVILAQVRQRFAQLSGRAENNEG